MCKSFFVCLIMYNQKIETMEKFGVLDLCEDELRAINGGGLFKAFFSVFDVELGLRVVAAVQGFVDGLSEGFSDTYNDPEY